MAEKGEDREAGTGRHKEVEDTGIKGKIQDKKRTATIPKGI